MVVEAFAVLMGCIVAFALIAAMLLLCGFKSRVKAPASPPPGERCLHRKPVLDIVHRSSYLMVWKVCCRLSAVTCISPCCSAGSCPFTYSPSIIQQPIIYYL